MNTTKRPTLSGWRPGSSYRQALRPSLGACGGTKESVGLAILSALSITSVWSAVCPSYFTMATFASRPEARERAKKGCVIGLGLSTATAAAIYFVFDDLMSALVAEGMALALFGISLHAIHSEPPTDTLPMAEQPEVSQRLP